MSEKCSKNRLKNWQDQEYRKKMLIILKDARKNTTLNRQLMDYAPHARTIQKEEERHQHNTPGRRDGLNTIWDSRKQSITPTQKFY